MEIKEQIFELLLNDYELVRKIAKQLDLQEASVQRWARRKQSRCVGLYPVVEIIKSHSGLNAEDIFEKVE
ncbi:hypothetical protein [Flavobacterium sp.]|uniref:hypothetical protein n=1 Tax=Flavobacterium sp. TaxID=239 RepID=UPI0025BADCE0|nr:hypothetical protein [Flavobacterium sp.]MBA4155039.1 hypothetical protein [Flavobacterium sp.]